MMECFKCYSPQKLFDIYDVNLIIHYVLLRTTSRGQYGDTLKYILYWKPYDSPLEASQHQKNWFM